MITVSWDMLYVEDNGHDVVEGTALEFLLTDCGRPKRHNISPPFGDSMKINAKRNTQISVNKLGALSFVSSYS
jgi:hypothetical protein